MAAADPLAALPSGTFPLHFSATANAALSGSKRAVSGEVVALRYQFKPASVTPQTPGSLEPSSASGGRIVAFDAASSGSQVFDVREEHSKERECVIVWDEGRQCFVLHALPSTYHLALNRTLSAQRAAGETEPPAQEDSRKKARTADSPASRESSPGPATRGPAAASRARASQSRKGLPSSALPAGVAAITESAPVRAAKKKAAPKRGAAATAAAALAAAGLSDSAPPPPKKGPKAAAKPKAAPKAKAAPKKKAAAAKAAAPPPAAKIKSVEIIEDSDEDEDDDGMDDFANMLGEAVQAAPELPGYDDDEEEEEEDEDDELGGAQFAGYQNDAAADEDSEWI